jgi:hypothetical protein
MTPWQASTVGSAKAAPRPFWSCTVREAFHKNVEAVTARQLKGKRGDLIYPQEYGGPPQRICDL